MYSIFSLEYSVRAPRILRSEMLYGQMTNCSGQDRARKLNLMESLLERTVICLSRYESLRDIYEDTSTFAPGDAVGVVLTVPRTSQTETSSECWRISHSGLTNTSLVALHSVRPELQVDEQTLRGCRIVTHGLRAVEHGRRHTGMALCCSNNHNS